MISQFMYSVCIYLGFYDALLWTLSIDCIDLVGLVGLDGRSIGVWDRKYDYISSVFSCVHL